MTAGPLVIPKQESADYISFLGMLDPRKSLLYMDTDSSNADRIDQGVKSNAKKDTDSLNPDGSDQGVNSNLKKELFLGVSNGDRNVADVMLMAAKFAYENKALIEQTVTNEWKVPKLTTNFE